LIELAYPGEEGPKTESSMLTPKLVRESHTSTSSTSGIAADCFCATPRSQRRSALTTIQSLDFRKFRRIARNPRVSARFAIMHGPGERFLAVRNSQNHSKPIRAICLNLEYLGIDGPALVQQVRQVFAAYKLQDSDFKIGDDDYFVLRPKSYRQRQVFSQWREGMTALASYPNVHVKPASFCGPSQRDRRKSASGDGARDR